MTVPSLSNSAREDSGRIVTSSVLSDIRGDTVYKTGLVFLQSKGQPVQA